MASIGRSISLCFYSYIMNKNDKNGSHSSQTKWGGKLASEQLLLDQNVWKETVDAMLW